MSATRRCPIVDTWWQTETGGILITPLPGATPLKPGSATRPFFGIEPVIVDGEGNRLDGVCEGNLCLARSWPGQMRTVFGDHRRFVETYFSTFPGLYFTGDGARRDADGFYWITGRVDDVINVAGHRLGTAEIESALVAHPKVAEAAVVGYPHDIKGQGIYAYVTLRADEEPSEELRRELVNWVRNEISPIAAPDLLQWAPNLPKTRSGKIMRRILRKIAEDQPNQLGDVSTLADPTVVDDLVDNRMNRAAGEWLSTRACARPANPRGQADQSVGRGYAVEFVIGLLADGWSEADILSNYPCLAHEDIIACLAYARDALNSSKGYSRPLHEMRFLETRTSSLRPCRRSIAAGYACRSFRCGDRAANVPIETSAAMAGASNSAWADLREDVGRHCRESRPARYCGVMLFRVLDAADM